MPSPLLEHFLWISLKCQRYMELPWLVCCSFSHVAFEDLMWSGAASTMWFPNTESKQCPLLLPKAQQDQEDFQKLGMWPTKYILKVAKEDTPSTSSFKGSGKKSRGQAPVRIVPDAIPPALLCVD